MRNIRLYIGGIRADLDSSITIPFTFQTTDAEMPTAVKNSYSKTVVLQGTETNRKLFGGLWHLDSLVLNPDSGIQEQFNPMKRVEFLLYVDEMIVERGYCQLLAINRKGRDYTFSISLFGGLGEFFYNLQTDSDGEKRTLADLDFGSDLSFKINKTNVQAVWDDILADNFPTIGFVPMHNGVPKTMDGDKMLIAGGGLPTTYTDGGNTYTTKDGYLLAKLNRKYTEWEIGDLRSYLQRPALRLKDFVAACCDPNNNGGWSVNLDTAFFHPSNPYYERTYILLPQLNVDEETEDICDDGTFGANSFQLTSWTVQGDLTPTSGCMTIAGNFIDMSSDASNAYLKVSLPVQVRVASGTNYGNLYTNRRFTGKTIGYCTTIQAVAYNDQNNVIGTSPRYVFACKNHHNEVQNLLKPTAAVSTSDALIEGVYKYSSGKYLFFQDGTNANTFALQIDKIARPSSTLHRVKIRVYVQRNFSVFTTKPRGNDDSVVWGLSAGDTYEDILGNSSNIVQSIQPTQYASDSWVYQNDLLSSLETTPLELLLSITKRFGLMWVQENQAKTVSLYRRENYYTGEVFDIHDRIDYSKGVKITPVAAKSNNYVLADEDKETTLSMAYTSIYGREYGEVRLKVGYDFGEDKVEMMEKCKLTEVVDGNLSGSGYWYYANANGELPSPIADGMSVTYYRTVGGQTDTKDVDYNLFSVTGVTKYNSPALGCACKTDDGEESAVEVAPSLVFVQGGEIDGTWRLSDDVSAMATLNNAPCWLWDKSLAVSRVPRFGRVAQFNTQTYSLDFGTPQETWYIPEVSLTPEQTIYHRYWEAYLADFLSRDTKVAECYVVFPPHLDMRQEMRKFYLFDRTLWVLNKITDYDPTKEQSVKCEFVRVVDSNAYHKTVSPDRGSGASFEAESYNDSFEK